MKTSIIRLREKKAIIASGSTFEKSLKTREIEKVAGFFQEQCWFGKLFAADQKVREIGKRN